MAAVAQGPNPLSQALLASMAPDYQTQEMEAQRRLSLAQALQQQAMTDTPGNGGAVSWTQGLARLAEALSAGMNAREGYKQMQGANLALGRSLSGAFMPQGGPQMGQGASPDGSGTPTPGNAPQAPGGAPAASVPFVPGQPPAPGQTDPLAPPPPAPPQAAPPQPSAPLSSAPPGGAGPMIPPLPGMSRQQSMMAYMADPSGYWDKIAAANAPTDFAKLLAQSNIDPRSPLGQQLMQAQVAKQNFTPPVSVRQNGVALDPYTNRVLFRNPNVGQNQGVDFDANGQPTRIYNIPGALDAAQAQAAATSGGQAAGKAPYDVVPSFQNGQPGFQSKANITGGILNGRFYGGGQGLPSGPAIGKSAAYDTYGKQSADAFMETQGISKESPQRVQALREMESLINGPGALTTGPTAAKMQHLAEEHGLPFGYSSNAFVFNKDAARFVAQSASDLGLNGSDARLGMMAHASPNMTMTPQALKTVIPTMIGLEYAKMAKATAASNWAQSKGPDTNAQFESTWRQSYDPRMFTAYAQGGPQALAKAPANLRQQWLKDYRNLKGMGVDFTQFAQ